ncbi:hypothetical protein [Pandoraea apista]
MTWIDVASDGVKIGVPALLTAIVSISVAVIGGRNSHRKETSANRRRLIENAVSGAEPFMRSFLLLMTETSNAARQVARAQDGGQTLSTAAIEEKRRPLAEQTEPNSEFHLQYHDAKKEVGLLILAGAEAEATILENLLDFSKKTRNDYFGSNSRGKLPSVTDVLGRIEQFSVMRSAFLTSCGRCYANL